MLKPALSTTSSSPFHRPTEYPMKSGYGSAGQLPPVHEDLPVSQILEQDEHE